MSTKELFRLVADANIADAHVDAYLDSVERLAAERTADELAAEDQVASPFCLLNN